MKHLAVIGGSGFIGTRLIEHLKSDYVILNIDKEPSQSHPAELTRIGDVRELESFATYLAGQDAVILLAAEHRDDVTPTSLYYEVNVQGTGNVLEAMDRHNIKTLIFTSSVAIYGINTSKPPSESEPASPFNHYGQSKWQAEKLVQKWLEKGEGRRALILRPTVIFGEDNRGNVYNLLKQIYSGKFLMIGDGKNCKSMAYVGNVVAFIHHMLKTGFEDLAVFNYVDKPDFDMNALVEEVYRAKGLESPKFRLPYWFGILAGYGFDLLAKLTGKKFPVSSIRIKKFCSSTVFDSHRLESTGFRRPYTLQQGLQRMLKREFLT